MNIEKGDAVLVSTRYHGLVWYRAEDEPDEYGDFMGFNSEGLECLNVENVDQVSKPFNYNFKHYLPGW